MDNINMMAAFLAIGNMAGEKKTLKEQVAYKQKIVFSTMKSMVLDWEQPGDWEQLSDEQKMDRLNKVEANIITNNK